MKIEYQIIQKKELEDAHRKIFADMLGKQKKVKGDLTTKADKCKTICIVTIDDIPAAIGAIKQKTDSDFTAEKAAVPELSKEFEWELGYLYTENEYVERGIASVICRTLIDAYGDGNLMASTEISANPATVRILQKNGFLLFGKPWKSKIHNNFLGLFLKFK